VVVAQTRTLMMQVVEVECYRFRLMGCYGCCVLYSSDTADGVCFPNGKDWGRNVIESTP